MAGKRRLSGRVALLSTGRCSDHDRKGRGRAAFASSPAAAAAALVAAASVAGATLSRPAGCEANLEEREPAFRQDTGEQRRSETFVRSQMHLVKPTKQNPVPVRVPPPVSGLWSSSVARRHVACMLGLPLRGKHATAKKLKQYLEFFHGASVKIFVINDYLGPGGNERMLAAIQEFFDAGGTEAKSGRFAILVPSDTAGGSNSRWNGASKFSRRWMLKTLQEKAQANLVFVEIKVDSAKELEEYTERLMEVRDVSREELDRLVSQYQEDYVGIQADGTEDDLAYMQVYNYNQKVVINNMMSGYLGSRMAHFLAAVHPYRHTIYLTCNGETEYNVAGKIGGDSSLTALGDQYARRVAEFADLVVGGGATDFEVVDMSEEQVGNLQHMITAAGGAEADSEGVFATDVGWEELDGGVKAGMRLARLRPRGSLGFVEAPITVEEVLELAGRGPTSLIFVDGEADLSLDVPARLVTSSLRRTKETAAHIRTYSIELENGRVWEQFSLRAMRNLDDVYGGEYEGLTTKDVRRREPQEAELRETDKLGYRYPRGESYYDIIARLDAVVKTFETAREPILIVSHLAVMRLIYAYIKGIPREDATEIDIPTHTVIKMDWDGTGHFNEESRYNLGPEGKEHARWS